MRMTESEFSAAAELALEALARALETSGAECDVGAKGDGLLELEFEDGSRIILNRHSAAQEIWVAAKSGGFHFRLEAGKWLNTRDATELFAVVSELVGKQSGRPVTLRAP